MTDHFLTHVRATLDQIRADGFYKTERVIESPQSPSLRIAGGPGLPTELPTEVLNFCANNYLGLADDPRLVRAAKAGLDEWGFGMASVRFICGTQSVHKQLEAQLAAFLRTDDSILYGSCFDANGGLFETLARRGRRDHQRRAEPCQHRRRHSSVQGQAFSLPQQRHGGPRGKARAGRRGRRPLQDDRDRWRVFDGWNHRRLEVDLRAGRPAPRSGDGRRFARRRLCRRRRPRHARILRGRRPRRHPHRHAGQGAGRGFRRLYCRTARGRRIAAAAVASVPVLQHAGTVHCRRFARSARPAAKRRRRTTAAPRARKRRALQERDVGIGIRSGPRDSIRSFR